MEEAVSLIIPKLTASVELIMNPATSTEDRLKAHQMIEEFKDTSSYCIPCGLSLAEVGHASVMRHFGLQLLEHGIKFQWNTFNDGEKQMLKSKSLEQIAKGSIGILEEESYIKDAISRVLVEVIKHEWPMKWKTLLSDLYNLSEQGVNQTELVLKVFLRLVEDVLTFQTVPQMRRKEIMSALTANTTELFEWFIALLQTHTTKAEALREEDTRASQCHVMVSATVLETLTGFADSLNITTILVKDNVLLETLCLLLSNSNLQLPAAECLLVLLSKRGRPEERKPLMVLFSEGAMTRIWNAAVAAEAASKDEHFYLFLKRLCQVIAELGKTLHALWGSSADVSQPPNFEKFLEALLAFTKHSSQMLSNITQSVWTSFFRHEAISEDPIFQKFISELILASKKTLWKVGYPSQNNSPSCDYARIDFDGDEEFTLFFSKYRSEILETMRQAAIKVPTMTFDFGSKWLESTLEQAQHQIHDPGNVSSLCNLSSPQFLEWDALSVYLESTMSKLCIDSLQNPDYGVKLLVDVIAFEAQDPLILSCQLSCMSALSIFLRLSPGLLMDALKKVFKAVVFELQGQTKQTRSKAVKNLRQHACSGLVKMCTKYHDLIFPVFDQVYEHIKTISEDPEQLSQMEKCILTEALILISNHFNDFEKESAFIGEVMKPVKELWLSEDFNTAFWNPDKYMSYIGLDQPAVEPSSADTCGINRSHITYCINLILAVMKRSVWPDDVDKAKEGGFMITQLDNGTYVWRNPATSHITILLENTLALLKTMNMLWHEEFLKLRHSDFEKSFDLTEKERHIILGIPIAVTDNTNAWIDKKPPQRMQNFLITSHEMCCHILGNAGACLGTEFYMIANLAHFINNTVLFGLEQIPEYRLRPIIRVGIKPLIMNCPAEHYETVVMPILAHLCPYMYRRLGAKWLLINQKYPLGQEVEDENPESEEVFQEQMTRLITKEYLELLAYILLGKKQEPAEDKMMEDSEGSSQQSQQQELTLGELGQLCFSSEAVFESIVLNIFGGLTWSDTLVCLKCTRLAGPVLKQSKFFEELFSIKKGGENGNSRVASGDSLLKEVLFRTWMSRCKLMKLGKMTPPAASEFFTSILMGLQLHGQHDLSQPLLLALAVLAYDLLRPRFSAVPQMLLELPSCTEKTLLNYEKNFLGVVKVQKQHEKKKRDAFRKLVESALGVNVSEQFQRKASYKPLGMFFKAKNKTVLMDEAKDLGLCSLFKPETGSDSAANGQGELPEDDSKKGQAIEIQIGTLGMPGNSSLQRSQSETDSPMKCV